MDRERKQSKNRILPSFLLLYALCLLAAVLFVLDARHIRFHFSGGQELVLPVGTLYTEPGVRAVSEGRLFGELGRELPVTAEGWVDCNTPGDYTIEYTATRAGRSWHARRTVQVRDLTPPVITLQHREGYVTTWFAGYEEEGYSAIDNIDGDLTDRVERRAYDDHVDYEVTDAAGNRSSVTREVPFSVGKPVITLTDGTETEIPAALLYTDPGFTAADEQGNDLSYAVQVSGEVDPERCGDYERVYRIDSGQGYGVTVTRHVRVVPALLPEAVEPQEKTIYLSFDDGPGPHTAQLLDVLAEYGVQASFFVTCRYPDYFDMVGRAFREGHRICVHTASHDYGQVYASEEAYYRDFLACEEMIREQTGSYTTLFRFPGGSSNTVSSFNEGIMTRLTGNMNTMGYQYFDWNVDSDDAGRTRTTQGVLQNVIAGCEGKDCCLVLQHDVKDYSVAAVRQIIEWGLNNGYVFKPLDMTSPPAHHPVAN